MTTDEIPFDEISTSIFVRIQIRRSSLMPCSGVLMVTVSCAAALGLPALVKA